MLIIHTADWHLGKKLANIDRIHEQRAVLDEIYDQACTRQADLIIVAGDVFDTATPVAEAEELFFRTLSKLSRVCPVIVIAGNHDDPVRLAAAERLALMCNVAIVKDIASLDQAPSTAVYTPDELVSVSSSGGYISQVGKGYITVTTPAETAVINVMPYPSESRLRLRSGETQSFTDIVADRLSIGAAAFRPDTVNITASHLFCTGSTAGGDERDIELGTARLIPIDRLPDSHYTALGHIHRCQRLSTTRNIHYSGSILQYSFDDVIAAKFIIAANITAQDGVTSVEKIELTQGRRLKELTVNTYEAAIKAIEDYPDYWLSIILKLDRALTDTETKRLRFGGKNIVRIKLEIADADIDHSKDISVKRSNREYFEDYCNHKRGTPPSNELTKLYLDIMEAMSHEAD